MEWLVIGLVTFTASVLTLFSGFGLGTILMPVAAIFLPVPVAITVTAIVHLLNKIFKLLLLWRAVDRHVLFAFGIPALLAAIPGAWLLSILADQASLYIYVLAGKTYAITPVKLVAGLLLIFFATAEWLPFLQKTAFQRLGLPLGGILSGFFGGLTGHQGAFRSAFLVQCSLTERGFVATNAAIAVLVDTIRLLIYGIALDSLPEEQLPLIALATVSSFLGVTLGAVWLQKVTLIFMQRLVAIMMYGLGGLLCLGII